MKYCESWQGDGIGRPDYGGFCQRSIGDAESKKELLEFVAVVNTRSVQHWDTEYWLHQL